MSINPGDRRDRLTKALDDGLLRARYVNGRIDITPDLIIQLNKIMPNTTDYTMHTQLRSYSVADYRM